MPSHKFLDILKEVGAVTGVSLRRFMSKHHDKPLSAAALLAHEGHDFRGYKNPRAFLGRFMEYSAHKPLPMTASNPDIRHWVLWGESLPGKERGGVDGLESFTSSPKTAAVYVGLGLPGISIITENAQAPVYVNPYAMVELDESFFDALDDKDILNQSRDNSVVSKDELNHQRCKETVRTNKDEITHINACYLRGKTYHFERDLRHSVYAVHVVSTAGRLAMSKLLQAFGLPAGLTEPMHIKPYRNLDFHETPLSLEITLAPEVYVKKMEEAAINRGIIGPDERLLRLEDACAVFPTSESVKQFDYEGVMKTLRVKSVPASIVIGDRAGLMEYLKADLKQFREDPAIHSMDHRTQAADPTHATGRTIKDFKKVIKDVTGETDSPSPAHKPRE